MDENCLSKDISGGCHNAHSSLRVEHKSNMSTVTMAWRVGNVNAGPDLYTSKHANTQTHTHTHTKTHTHIHKHTQEHTYIEKNKCISISKLQGVPKKHSSQFFF